MRRAFLATVALGLALAGCGGGGSRSASTSSTQSVPGGRLAIGLTEFDPALIAPDGPGLSAPIVAMRTRVAALRPRYLRMTVIWSGVQPRAGVAPNWDRRSISGHSVRQQLRAIAAARRAAGGGFEPVVTVFSTPGWAATRTRGCQPRGANPDARAPALSAMPAYRRLIGSLLALGEQEGVPLRFFSAWNEPNSGLFLAPQRLRCDPRAPSLGPLQYARIVRALRAELDSAPGDQHVLVGETSSPFTAHDGITTLDEFVRRLPADALCAGDVWTQHQYVGDADRLGELERLLAARPCPGSRRRIWITETGVGARKRIQRRVKPAVLERGCRALDATLRRWYADPLIDAAFQYTFREDPNFPVGLASPDLHRLYPAYRVWRAWGGDRRPAAPAPAAPDCG